MSLLRLFMLGSLHTPITKLLELDFALNFFLVFFAHVVRPFADGAVELDKAVL